LRASIEHIGLTGLGLALASLLCSFVDLDRLVAVFAPPCNPATPHLIAFSAYVPSSGFMATTTGSIAGFSSV